MPSSTKSSEQLGKEQRARDQAARDRQYGETDNRSSGSTQNRLDAKMDQRKKDAEQERRTADRELSESKSKNGALGPKPVQSKSPGVRLGQPLDPLRVGVTLDRVRPDQLGVKVDTDGGSKGGTFGVSSTDNADSVTDVAKPVKAPVQQDDEEVVPQVKFTRHGIPAFLGGLPNSLFSLLKL